MPITGPSSYLLTIEQFEQHWATADATLGVGNEIVLPDGTNQNGLTTKKGELTAKRAEVQARLNDKEVARGELELKKSMLLQRLVQFNEKVRAFFAGSKWLNALPDVPGQREAQSKITDPLDDIDNLWQQINADPATASPITLLGGYDQATFNTDLVALKGTYTTLNASETSLKVAREERNQIQRDAYAILKNYRQVLPTFFAKDDAIVESLPRLTPLSGATPDAVTASAEWDATTSQAKITWTPSSDPKLDRYEIRFVSGPDYSTDDESISGSVDKNAVPEFFTLDGLSGPGTIANYKVYVVLDTGNEKGSNAVSVTHSMP